MRSVVHTLAGIAVALSSSVSHAQLFRAYVASTGNDANPCTIVAPCRLVPAALAVVASGGEVWMLDSANYNTNPVNVHKSVTLLAVPGAIGSIVVASGPAILIDTAGVDLTLRNLVIVPLPGSAPATGINMTDGASLTIEGSVLANIPGDAIAVTTAAKVNITDTSIRGSTGHAISLRGGAQASITRAQLTRNQGSGVAIELPPGSAALTTAADVTDSTLDGHDFGVMIYNTSTQAKGRASVRSSLITRSTYGLLSQSSGGAQARLTVSDTTVTNCTTAGLGVIGAGAFAWASGNSILGNATGFHNAGGVLETRNDNVVRGNGTNKFGPTTAFVGE